METEACDWHSAVLAAGKLAGVTEPLAHLGSSAASNWLWFAEWPGNRRALEVGGGAGDTTAALMNHFQEVEYLDPDPGWVRFTKLRFKGCAPTSLLVRHGGAESIRAPAEWYSCISLTVGSSHPDETTRPALAECRRCLAPGGVLRLVPRSGTLTHAGPRAVALLASAWKTRAAHRAWVRAMRDAGFARAQVFYGAPSLRDPRTILPVDRRTLVTAEGLLYGHSGSGRLRRWAIAAGLHGAFYPEYFLLARQ